MKNKNMDNNLNKINIIEKKSEFFKNVIENTLLHINKNKILGVLSIIDINICTAKLCDLITIIKNITIDTNENIDNKINKLQEVNNELSCLIKNYGTYNLFDLLIICFGATKNDKNDFKLELLQKYFHPIGYKIMNKTIHQDNNTLGCFDINNSYKQFYVKVHGLKVNYYNDTLKKGIIII
jgi:hypothetical protein